MKLINQGVMYENGIVRPVDKPIEEGRQKTICHGILTAHDNHADPDLLHITFDSLTSHDITYVGIIQTARASGLKKFPMPYVR